jgi:hypothetical protein
MVDALWRMRGWLKPDGYLIDLRPAEVAPSVEIGPPGRDHTIVGVLTVEEERRLRHRAADRALCAVLEQKLFRLEEAREFWFIRYADSARELQAYIAGRWHDARLDDLTRLRAETMLRGKPNARLWLRERVGIRSLRLADALTVSGR